MTTTAKRKMSPLAIVLILSGVFFALFMVVSGVIFIARPSGKPISGSGRSIFGGGTVGIIELNGVIMDSKKVLKNLERFEEDDSIKAVVLRLNSPGGAVAPSQEIYEAVKNYKKPLVASMSTVAASGAFYIAMGAKKIFANPGTLTGSIGVIMEFANLEKLYQWAKIHRYVIKTGKFKDAGSEYREMTAEERQLLSTMLDDVLSQFKKAVQTGRKLSAEKVTQVADGRIFSGSQAKAAGLVDQLGTLQDAVDDAAKMARIKGKPTIVYPERSHRKLWMDLLMDDKGDDAQSESTPLRGGLASDIHHLVRLISGSMGLPSDSSESSSAFVPGIYWLWNGS